MATDQRGFHLLGIVIVLAVLTIIGLAGYNVFSRNHAVQRSGQVTRVQATDSTPVWQYDQQKLAWKVANGTAPQCPDPLRFGLSPVDMSAVTAVGLPGAYRGGDYKAHGGFRLTDSTHGATDVKLPMDAKLLSIKRYYESVPGHADTLQYLIDFENGCGIAMRFDHLYELTPKFQAIADKSAPAKLNDTRGDPNAAPLNVPFEAGMVIATKVGFPETRNYGFDFGVYDYRSRNKISNNPKWAAIHKQFSPSTYHGVCWLPLLPQADAVKAEAMAKDRNNYDTSKPFNLTSDYCDFAPYTTLDFNNGLPTNG